MERVIELLPCTIRISIASCGVYSFGDLSGQGKSYLCSLLKKSEVEDILVISSTNSQEVLDALNNTDCSLIIIDRFDLVKSKDVVDKVKTLNDKYIVLDYKNYLYDKCFNVKSVLMDHTEEEIRLYKI